MTSAAVNNYNSPAYVDPYYGVSIEGPPLDTQTNNNKDQSTRFGIFNPGVNDLYDPSAATRQESVRWSPLMSVPTMAPIGDSKLYQDVDHFCRINQDPRTMMDYAEAPYGMARGERSLLTWKENKPEPLLKVTNKIEIQRQKQRDSMRRF